LRQGKAWAEGQAWGLDKNMTASDMLMESLQDFGEAEGIDAVILYTTDDKKVCIRSNCGAVTALGMAEWARNVMLDQIGLGFPEEGHEGIK